MTKYDGVFVGAGGMDLKIVTVILFFFGYRCEKYE